MTIDERIEALPQSVELLATIQRDNERANAERWAETDRRMREIMESINTLGRIAGLHHELLDEHGERLDNLEKQ